MHKVKLKKELITKTTKKSETKKKQLRKEVCANYKSSLIHWEKCVKQAKKLSQSSFHLKHTHTNTHRHGHAHAYIQTLVELPDTQRVYHWLPHFLFTPPPTIHTCKPVCVYVCVYIFDVAGFSLVFSFREKSRKVKAPQISWASL